ncbi:MAG: peptidylprolyl isomerase [Planctomycetes bacterium]|nr:peptidylprolyl isomerase [Planctomycetota bacterium]
MDIEPAKLEPLQIHASKGETREDAARRTANELYRMAREGKDFSELAKDNSHGHRRTYGGLWTFGTPNALEPP